MRKKQLVSRIISNEWDIQEVPPITSKSSNELNNNDPEGSPLLFKVNSDGLTTLPDGTPVVEPVDPSTQVDRPKTTKLTEDAVKCTSCGIKLHLGINPIKVHPILNVIVCKSCAKYYSKQNFMKDATGKHDICRWCADGGDLICCDCCANAFCKRCIRRNLGRGMLHKIESLGDTDVWKCFVCDRSPTLALRKHCAEVLYETQESQSIQKRRLENRRKSEEARRGSVHKNAVSKEIAVPNQGFTTINENSVSQPLSGAQTSQAPPTQLPSSQQQPPQQSAETTVSTLSNILQILGQTLTAPNPQVTGEPDRNHLFPRGSRPLPTRAFFPVGRPTMPQRTETIRVNPMETSFLGKSSTVSLDTSVLLNQIASVNEVNIRAALKATRRCVDSFSLDLQQLENKMANASNASDIDEIVRSFQSLYRFHLIARLANLSSRMREEMPCLGRLGLGGRLGGAGGPCLTQSSLPVTIDLTEESPSSKSPDQQQASSSNVQDSSEANQAADVPMKPDPSRDSLLNNNESPSAKRRCIRPALQHETIDAVSPSAIVEPARSSPLCPSDPITHNMEEKEANELIPDNVSIPPETTAVEDVQELEGTRSISDVPIPESSVQLEDIRPHLGDTSIIHLKDHSKLGSKVATSEAASSDVSPLDSDDALGSDVSAFERSCDRFEKARSKRPLRESSNKDSNRMQIGRTTRSSKRKRRHESPDWDVEEENVESKPADASDQLKSNLANEADAEYYADLDYRKQLLQSSSAESSSDAEAKHEAESSKPADEKTESVSGKTTRKESSLYTRKQRALMKSSLTVESDVEDKKSRTMRTRSRRTKDGDDTDSDKTSKSSEKQESPIATSSSSSESDHTKVASSRSSRQTRSSARQKQEKKKEEDIDSDNGSEIIKFSRSCKKINKKVSRHEKLNTSGSSQSDDSQEQPETRQKRRVRPRRRRRLLDASEEESQDNDSNAAESDTKADSDKSDAEKCGRRRIRKIKSQSSLSQTTKTAEAEERERRRRIAERQKQYNDCILQETAGLDVVTKKLVLEKSSDNDTPLIEVHPDLLKHLKPHQVEAVRFLWDCVIESVDRQKQSPSTSSNQTYGAILAHCMGLGKTLSVIAFLHTLFTHSDLLNIESCLVLCPINTLLNWKQEWQMWLPEDSSIDVFELVTKLDFRQRVDVLKHWHRKGGVMLMGYDMFRNFVTPRGKKGRGKTTRNSVNQALLDPGPDIVVCDEGHVLKNDKSGLTKAVSQLRTLKRIVLTGTPLQNNLNEYHAMVNFVKPNLLGTAKEFNNRFGNPIRNGQHSNSTQRDVSIMKKRAHVLYKTLDGCVQRKDYNALTKYLPPRYEYVIMCRLSSVQCELYRTYLDVRGTRAMTLNLADRKNSLFADQQTIYRIVTHPFLLRSHETREARKMLLEDDDDDDFIDESDTTEGDDDESSQSSSASTSPSDKQAEKDNRNRSTRPQRVTRSRANAITEEEEEDNDVVCLDSEPESTPVSNELNGQTEPEKKTSSEPWWYKIYKEEYDWALDVGGKLDALFCILKKCMDIGDKVLIFTQSLLSLDLLEKFLEEINRQWLVKQGAPDKLPDDDKAPRPDLSSYFSDVGMNTWVRGLDYERMDGSMNAVVRKGLQHRFNRNSNSRLRLFLISTRAGGLGINLVSANRLILFDASWNPSNDVQSIFRSYRFGQTKPVYIYRLIAQGTMEEKIYDRQVMKQSLSLRVIDELQIGRHFSNTDLLALYTFDPDVWDPIEAEKRPTPKLPKDRLLADMLSEFPHLISKYHEHDSLLEHREDEGLTEEERQEAWREYEEEKRLGMSLAQHQRMMQQQEFMNQTQAHLQNWRALQIQQYQQQLLNQRTLPNVAPRPAFNSTLLTNSPLNPLQTSTQYRNISPYNVNEFASGTQNLNQRTNNQAAYPLLFEKYREYLLRTRPDLTSDPVALENMIISQILETMTKESRTKLPTPHLAGTRPDQPRPSH